MNHTIFDKQAFTSTVTPVIQGESSRQAIASTITERAFADKPLVNQLIGKNVTALIAGLLATDAAQQLTAGLIDRSYTYLTTDDPKPIAIDLTAIKNPLEKITEVVEAQGRDVKINPANIPDAIVLFSPAGLPDIYGYSVLMLWLGPLFGLGFIVLGVLYFYLGRSNYPRRVYTLGATIIGASVIGLLIGPLVSPPIAAQVQAPELRGVVTQLIDALLAPFASQNITAIVITAIVLIIFASRHMISRGTQWLLGKASTASSNSKSPSQIKNKS